MGNEIAYKPETPRLKRPNRSVSTLHRRPGVPTLGQPTVGRAGERLLLARHIEKAQQGGAVAVTITGEAGIGKTHLLRDIVDRLEPPWLVFKSRAHKYDRAWPYATLQEILASVDTSALARGTVTQFQRASRQLEEVSRAADASDEGSGRPAYVLVVDLLRLLTREHPVLLALDDADQADPDTLTALSIGLRHLAQRPLAVVSTVRRDRWRPGNAFRVHPGDTLRAPVRRHHRAGASRWPRSG